jgi:hypothetical protein
MTPAGFPHSDIPGSKTVCVSPRLIAAYHVLHRLLVPRHPPCALSSLTGIMLQRCFRVFAQRLIFDCQRAFATRQRSARDHDHQSREISIWAHQRILMNLLSYSGGDSGARTRSLRLAKPALSQLSYIPVDCPGGGGRGSQTWWAWVDSNHPPHAYQACALTN